MSPPNGLPPGLPQRPNFNSYDDSRSNDNYRPLPPPPKIDYSSHNRDARQDSYAQPRRNDTFQFGAGGGGGSSRNDSRNDPYAPRQTSYRGDPPSFPRGGVDSYRPQSSEFSFRQDAPSGVDVNRLNDTYRPSDSTRRHYDRRDQGRHGGRPDPRDRRPPRGRPTDRRGRGGFSKKAAERPFLVTNRAPTPELLPGMDDTEEHAPKFKALDDLSESDSDSGTSKSDASAGEEEGQPKKKQARTSAVGAADGNSVPKWSNPDPYTALPCPDESAAKKKDVVQLIRKARVAAAVNDSKPVAEADDFISFNFDDDKDDEEDDEDEEEDMSISSGGTGSKPGQSTASGATSKSFSHRTEVVGERPVAKGSETSSSAKPRALDTSTNPELGNRKRTYDDRIKLPPMLPKPAPRHPAKGGMLKEWRPDPEFDESPWLIDHSRTVDMAHWLHMEIVDFYNRFKPIDIEEKMRAALISDLNYAVKSFWRDADILPFGSYPAGLYLPTADMDCVFVSKNYMAGSYAKYSDRRTLWKFKDFLVDERIAAPDSIECITKAKVPLVKYIDRKTGLKVDVSFENDSGIKAIETFREWKRKYPAMPVLVTLIKQFLCMRGLNEPVNGGIGGFTVTCLVVSLLQHMPQVQSGNMIPEHHLGEVLMEFFNLYGNMFDTRVTAIQTEPPRWLPKQEANRRLYRANTAEKFCIIDPNDPCNDISGGALNTPIIVGEFRGALAELNSRMAALRTMDFEQRRNQSILKVILGGNYSSFEVQRRHLERVWVEARNRR